jgi:DNA-binding MarR family transcriptional regulator
MMQTELADALDVGKASLGTLIDRLEAGGFVERREDPTDRRAKRLYMAEPGYELLERMTHEEIRFNERVLGGLSATDRETMIRTLTAIKRVLSTQIVPGEACDED